MAVAHSRPRSRGATSSGAANVHSGKSIASSRVYGAVDKPTDVAVLRFVP